MTNAESRDDQRSPLAQATRTDSRKGKTGNGCLFSVSGAFVRALSVSAGFFKRTKHTPRRKNPALTLRALVGPVAVALGIDTLNTYEKVFSIQHDKEH